MVPCVLVTLRSCNPAITLQYDMRRKGCKCEFWCSRWEPFEISKQQLLIYLVKK